LLRDKCRAVRMTDAHIPLAEERIEFYGAGLDFVGSPHAAEHIVHATLGYNLEPRGNRPPLSAGRHEG